MTDSLVAVLSEKGRTNVTAAPVAVTDDTETLVGSANLGKDAAMADILIARLGPESALADIFIIRPTAITAARPTQIFLTPP